VQTVIGISILLLFIAIVCAIMVLFHTEDARRWPEDSSDPEKVSDEQEPFSASSLRRRRDAARLAREAAEQAAQKQQQAFLEKRAANIAIQRERDLEAAAIHVREAMAKGTDGLAERLPLEMMRTAESEGDLYSVTIVSIQRVNYLTDYDTFPIRTTCETEVFDSSFLFWLTNQQDRESSLTTLANRVPQYQRVAQVCHQYGYSMKLNVSNEKVWLTFSL
jgi:hypothetical protein